MRYWRYTEPGENGPVTVVMSDEDIIREYGPHWIAKMHEIGKAELVSIEGLIDDWITVHWAIEIPAVVPLPKLLPVFDEGESRG